jgi:hypothetical protein
MRVWLTGAEQLELELERSLLLLLVLFGNGLDGDVRFEGSSPECIDALRGLVVGTGNCVPIAAPADSALWQPGDECYRQQDAARVFLCTTPRS